MEQDAAWVPCDFRLPQWSMEPGDFQPANWTAACAPGIPVESACTGIFGGCFQASVPIYDGGQMVEYAAAAKPNPPVEEAAQEFVVEFGNIEMKVHDAFEETAAEFKADIKMMKEKIHRYPASIRALGDWYTVPRMVAIGPYHHDRGHLKAAEKVKQLAAYHCVKESGRTVQEMYDAVVQVAHQARGLYDKDVMEGISDDDFLPMMFYDACFLVQYMFMFKRRPNDPSGEKDFIDPWLQSVLDTKDHDHEILHDVLLLENQIPWRVVEAIMSFRPVPLKDFITSFKGILRSRKEPERFVFDGRYEPPHILGLFRFYIVGRSSSTLPPLPKGKSRSYTVSATELAKIGIRLVPNKTTDLIDISMTKKGALFADLSLAALSLDYIRTSCLVNMAALEMCSVRSFNRAPEEDSAVCSYLLLFSMVLDREEDVQELQKKGLLQGGARLTDSQALNFFKSLESLRLGKRYIRIMKEIEHYRVSRQTRTKVHTFYFKNKKTILTVFTIIVGVIGIIGTLRSLQGRR